MKYFFKNVAGVVLASQKFNKNVIHSSGGGGFVSSNYGGYVSAPKIYSVNKSTQEIFIKTLDGKEEHIVIHNQDIPIREGHELSVILVGNERHSYWVSVLNKTLNKKTILIDDNALVDLRILLPPLSLKQGLGLYIFIGLALLYLVGITLMKNILLGIASVLGVALWLFIVYWIFNLSFLIGINYVKRNNFYKKFESYFESIKR